MSTKGLFIPLSVVVGDTLDVAFDVAFDGNLIHPDDITLEGQFINGDSSIIEEFAFINSSTNDFKVHARISSDVTSGLEIGEYTYQIRFSHDTLITDLPESLGDQTTILYGSLTLIASPLIT